MSLKIEEKPVKKWKEIPVILQSIIQMSILLVISLIGLFIMLILLFILIRNMPVSPYSMEISEVPSQDVINLWGLEKTPIQQFFIFLWNTVSGNWGDSLVIRRDTPVKLMINDVYFKTFEFNLISFTFSLLIGIPFGYLAFIFRDKWIGRVPQALKRLNWAILVFGLGMLLQYIFGYALNVLPSTQLYDPNLPSVPTITGFRLIDCLITGNFEAFFDSIVHLIMPIFCQSFIMISFITELTYSIMDFYKSPNDMHFFTGKIAFYLGFIFTSNMLLAPTFHLAGMGLLAFIALSSLDVFVLSALLYQILLTFLIINIFINILIHIILIVRELRKISKTDNNITKPSTNSDASISESKFDVQGTVSKPIEEENALVVEHNEDEKPAPKEILKKLLHKINNPLAICGIILISISLFIAIFAKSIAPYDYEFIDNSVAVYSAPSNEHILGVTKFSRDVLSRCLFGIQTAVRIGFISTIIGMPLGVLMGSLSAFFGKWVKYFIDTINGMVLFIPGFIFAYAIRSILEPDYHNFYWILGLVNIPIATLFTQQVISYEMKKGDISPGKFTKPNGRKILSRLPNINLSILGVGCLVMGLAILTFESLNYMGLGDPMIASLGMDMSFGATRLTSAPWAAFSAAFCSYITILGFIMLGIGLKRE